MNCTIIITYIDGNYYKPKISTKSTNHKDYVHYTPALLHGGLQSCRVSSHLEPPCFLDYWWHRGDSEDQKQLSESYASTSGLYRKCHWNILHCRSCWFHSCQSTSHQQEEASKMSQSRWTETTTIMTITTMTTTSSSLIIMRTIAVHEVPLSASTGKH